VKRREFLVLPAILAGCGGSMEYQIQPSPIQRTSKTTFTSGVEQEWTPGISFLTPGDVSVVYTTRVGRYYKLGSLVIAFFMLDATPTYTTASGNFLITGFPHPARSTGGISVSFGNLAWEFNLTAGYTDVMPQMFADANYCGLLASGDALAVAAISTTHLASGTDGRWEGCVIYIASDQT